MVVSKFRVPAFIITMAMMNVCNGIAYVYSGGQSTRITDKFFIAIGTGYLFNIIPLPVVYMVILIIVFSFLLSKTKFGTYVYAIGGNREAARLSGVPIKKVEIIVFTLSGALAAFAGLVLASRMYSGQPSVGSGYEMDAIAACVLGGTSMAGGRGRISGTVFGAMVIGIISNGLNDRCQLLLAADCKGSDHCLRGCTGFPEGQSGTPQKKEMIPRAHLERQGEKNGLFQKNVICGFDR
jgi:ribose transport system permease protein